MRYLTNLSVIALFTGICGAPAAQAQTALNLHALQGLAPFSALGNTQAGKAVLAANYTVTGAIQTGTANQPALQPFADQQKQALRDAYITFGNAAEFADGLGSKLGAVYLAGAAYNSSDNGKTATFTSISPDIANLILYSATLTQSDSNAAKYFFANGTSKTGKGPAVPASAAAEAILAAFHGTTDVLGKAYGVPAGSKGADPYGDSRPYQTEKTVLKFTDPDYYGEPSGNDEYLNGPAQDLTASPSFPSGHTTYGYTESTLLAILVPARFTQEVTRGAEYGNSRIIVGAHYAVDVIGGRTLAYYDLAQLLSENPAYLGQKEGKAKPIAKYDVAVKTARSELIKDLETGAGENIASAAAQDTSRFSNPSADQAFYESTQTYGLPVVYPDEAAKPENIAAIAPEAGYLLTAAFPYLTLKQADHILTVTEGPGGGFLDNGSHFGVYSRLDLYKAGQMAEAEAPK
jgi:membrane-associated phospholipid phosphatase